MEIAHVIPTPRPEVSVSSDNDFIHTIYVQYQKAVNITNEN